MILSARDVTEQRTVAICLHLDACAGESEGSLCQQQEYRKVFKPHGCALHHFNPEHFEQCLTGRRIIIIGDSTMRQMFQSLACLMTPRIVGGFFMVSGFPFALCICLLLTTCIHSPCPVLQQGFCVMLARDIRALSRGGEGLRQMSHAPGGQKSDRCWRETLGIDVDDAQVIPLPMHRIGTRRTHPTRASHLKRSTH